MDHGPSTSSWQEVIYRCLEDLRKKHPNLSGNQIADKINISRATFNRLDNDGTKPRLDTFIRLILGSGNGEMLEKALTHFDPDLARGLALALQVALKEENHILVDQDLESLFDNPDIFITYLVASIESGATRESILNCLGAPGLDALNALITRGLLIERADRIFCKDKKILVRSFESVKHHLPTYARYYHPEHVGRERNYVHSMTDGLSLEGIKKLQAAHRQFHETVKNLMRDPQNRGDIAMFSVAFCDSFVSMPDNSEKEAKQ